MTIAIRRMFPPECGSASLAIPALDYPQFACRTASGRYALQCQRMTTQTAPNPPQQESEHHYDPDSYRMTIGEHLEELRWRMVLGLGGFFIALIACMCFPDPLMRFFLRPLMLGMKHNHFTPQVNFQEVAESFMTYIRVSMIVGGAIASPWLLYQLWQFVAAGLYPKERKYITKYLPLSITLLITGMVFLYYIALPLMIEFFLSFNFGPSFDFGPPGVDTSATTQPFVVPMLNGDPPHPTAGQLWMNLSQEQLKFFYDGHVRILQFGSERLGNPLIMLSDYIDMVISMLLSFGVAFQLPLVVLALVRIGIVQLDQLKRMRRMAYFVCTIIAAVIVPDVMTGMVALMIPLIVLYELGIWLAREIPAPDDAAGSNNKH
jgi:sec-independent protein translocase protein TatC